MDTHILVPVMKNEEDEGTEEIKPFEGNSELYYVNESILEVNESGKSVSDPSLPIKEHNQIVRMSGYLTTTNKDGKSQRPWCELAAGILRLSETPVVVLAPMKYRICVVMKLWIPTSSK